jgi:hypothetical protein
MPSRIFAAVARSFASAAACASASFSYTLLRSAGVRRVSCSFFWPSWACAAAMPVSAAGTSTWDTCSQLGGEQARTQ